MPRSSIMLYAILSYVMFLGVTLWMIAFLLDLDGMRSTASATTWPMAILINVGLISLFGLVHSVMARPAFRRVWVRLVSTAAERATYVFQSSVLLGLIFFFWQPVPVTFWLVEVAFLAVFGFGLVLIVLATFLLDHFEFTGLRQAWDHMNRNPSVQPNFRTPFLY